MEKITLEKIQEIYSKSDVCLRETLATTPALGLTIKEAFELYIKALKWNDGDRFFRLKKRTEVEELLITENETGNKEPLVINDNYKEFKSTINSMIMEMACELSVKKMIDKHEMLPGEFIQPDPEDHENGTVFKDEYQDEFNKEYDIYYEGICNMMAFDYNSPDGVNRG